MGAASIPYPWPLRTWQAAALIIAFLAAVGAGLVVTLPRPVALRLLLLLAVPAVPCAVWVAATETSNAPLVPFPELASLLMLLLACVSAVAAWQSRHGSKTA